MPLLEKHTQNIATRTEESNKSLVTETPNTYKAQKITTPPETVFAMGKRGSILETPTTKNQSQMGGLVADDAGSGKKVAALLSPAFSSPQEASNRFQGRPQVAAKLSFDDLYSSHFEFEEKALVKKKTKRTKREMKEMAFELDSNQKPPYSYATLIGMSILSNSKKKLTLSQIYQWISDTFKYYRRDEVGWQNSIRHNLSLNKAFVKGEKSKDGKGHFWCIQPGCEEQFLKVKNSRKRACKDLMDQVCTNSYSANKISTASIPSSPNAPQIKWDCDRTAGANQHLQNDSKQHYEGRFDDDEYPGRKRLKSYIDDSTSPVNNSINTPYKHWQGASNNERYNQDNSFLNHLNTPKLVVEDSPSVPILAGKNLTFTSSFSCNSNLELSPIHLSETGPLLEPLTPVNNAYRTSGSINQHSSSLQAYHYSSTTSLPSSHILKTPKGTIKTPLRNLRTPQTASVVKKLWQSPSYLDEFYYSPLISSSQAALTSYDDDDMIMRAFELPKVHAGSTKKPIPMSPVATRCKNQSEEVTKKENSGDNTETAVGSGKEIPSSIKPEES